MRAQEFITEAVKQRLDPKCWKGKHKEGTKIKGGVRVNNCVPNENMAEDTLDEKWSQKYKNSINCSNPKGFSQKAHCAGKKKHNESTELTEEFDLIETVVEGLALRNGVDSEVIWEDLESLTDDELYVFAATAPVMESEAWQKANKKDRTDGMSRKAVKTYRREHPGSKLQTAVTTKPSKLKKGSKASKRRKSYCSRSRGQMKMHNISCQKTPDKAICKARRRWNC